MKIESPNGGLNYCSKGKGMLKNNKDMYGYKLVVFHSVEHKTSREGTGYTRIRYELKKGFDLGQTVMGILKSGYTPTNIQHFDITKQDYEDNLDE